MLEPGSEATWNCQQCQRALEPTRCTASACLEGDDAFLACKPCRRSTAALVWFRCGHAAHSFCFRAKHKPAKCDLCARIDGEEPCTDGDKCQNVCANWIQTSRCRFGDNCLYAMRCF